MVVCTFEVTHDINDDVAYHFCLPTLQPQDKKELEVQKWFFLEKHNKCNTKMFPPWPGRVAQLVACLATDASLTADPGVASSIPARSHTFVEIDHEIVSMIILLPSPKSFKKGCCQLQAKACARSTG